MDELVPDVRRILMSHLSSTALTNLVFGYPEEVRQAMTDPQFWSSRLENRYPEILARVEKFQINMVLAPPVNPEVVTRMLDYCEMHEYCHIIAAALALNSFPTLEVVTAALACIQGEFVEPGVPRPRVDELGPREKDISELRKAFANCLARNPEHLASILAYVWIYDFAGEHAYADLLAEDLPATQVVLDTLLTLNAHHVHAVFLDHWLNECLETSKVNVGLLQLLVNHATRHHYHDILVYLYSHLVHAEKYVGRTGLPKDEEALQLFVVACSAAWPEGVRAFSSDFSIGYYDSLNFPWPPLHCNSQFPTPLLGSIYEEQWLTPEAWELRGVPRKIFTETFKTDQESIFDCSDSFLDRMIAEGADLAKLALEETALNPYVGQRSFNYSSVPVLYHILAQEGQEVLDKVFGDPNLYLRLRNAWRFGNEGDGDTNDNARAFLLFLIHAGFLDEAQEKEVWHAITPLT